MRRCTGVAAIALVALLLAVPALAKAPQAGKFTGTTSQADPSGAPEVVNLSVTNHGAHLKRLDIGWVAACDSGFTQLSQATRAQGSISGRGKFHGKGTYTSTTGNLVGTQYSAQVTSNVRGRFISKTKAKGTFQATAVLLDANGTPVSTCTTQTVTWRASHL
jgi:hypothetical protein